MSEYFGGSSVTGHVRRLTATSFKELVDGYINIPVTKNVTRREFHGYDKDTKDKIKDGPYVTAATFKGDGPRLDANCTGLGLLFLDIDDAANGNRIYGAKIRDLLHPYNHFVYETVSSTRDARRLRVGIDLAPMPVGKHKAAVRHVATLLGLDLATWSGYRESHVLSQPMFRPVQFVDEDHTAVLSSRTDGVELTELDIPEHTEGEDDRSYAYTGDTGESSLDYLPVAGLGLEDLTEPLIAFKADDSYHGWVKVGMALRHQFRESEEEAKAAFEVFNAWSAQGSKYDGEEATYRKWMSFAPDTTGRAPVTIRSLFELAIATGWNPAQAAAKVKKTLSGWIAACVSPDLLMQRGAARIAAMPFKNEIVEESLCGEIRRRLAELNPDQKIALATIRKGVKTARRKKAMEENSDTPAWLRPEVYISTRNIFRNMANGVELSPEAFNNTYSQELMNLSPESESALTGKPTILPVHFALNVHALKRVDGTTYDPRFGGAEPFFEHEGKTFLNEYRLASLPVPDPLLAGDAKTFLTYAAAQIFGEADFHMLNFFAHTVQFPGQLIRHAPLIQSGQGAGKNLFCNVIGAALGEANYKVVNAKQVMGDFNEWLGGSCLTVLDEIKIPGHNKAELTNSLKDGITNDKVSVNKKFQSLQVVQNVSNKIALTNWPDALHLEDSDRRWYMVRSPIQTREHQQQLAEAGFYRDLAYWLTQPGAVLQMLLDWKILDDFDPNGSAPETSFRAEMLIEGKNRLLEEIEDLIEGQTLPMVADDLIFYPAMSAVLSNLANNHKPSHYLRNLGYQPYQSGQKFTVNGTRGTIWIKGFDDDFGDPEKVLEERSKLEVDL